MLLKKCHVYADQQNAMAIGHQVTVVSKKKKKKLHLAEKHDAAQIQWPLNSQYTMFILNLFVMPKPDTP